jgi:uncharacterized protein (DUF433 family)
MISAAALRPTSYPHIYLDEHGCEWIDDTNVKVIMVVMDVIGPNRMSAEQIQIERPRLSLAQIHAALAYYHDNKPAVDAALARLDQDYQQLRARTEDSAHQARLRTIKEERARPSGA